MYFLIEDDDLLKNIYNTIWDKVSADMKKEFGSEAVYNKFLKTKIEFFGDEATDDHERKIPKMDSNLACLAVISLDSAVNKDGNLYLQVFLKE